MTNDKKTLLVLAVLALIVRGLALGALYDNLQLDPDDYRQLAESWRQTGVFGWTRSSGVESRVEPTAFRPPLYPLILGVVAIDGEVTTAAVALLHLLLGVATVVLTYFTGIRHGLGRWSLFASALVALDPILLNQSSLVMTETLATFLAVLGLSWLARFDWQPTYTSGVLAGGTLALSALCRPTFLPWLGLVVLLYGWRFFKQRRLALALAFVGAAVVVFAPWPVRNYWTFGRFLPTTTHGGYTLLLGNNSLFYDYLRSGDRNGTWDARPLSAWWQLRVYSDDPSDAIWGKMGQRGEARVEQGRRIERTEVEDDRFAYQLAWRYIRAEPGMFLRASLVRVVRLWRILPHARSASQSRLSDWMRFAVGFWYSSVLLLALLGVAALGKRLLRRPWLWGVLLICVFTGVHTLYWSNMRMRAPLMPWVCIVAGEGLRRGVEFWLQRK